MATLWILICVMAPALVTVVRSQWSRWEERTIDCTTTNGDRLDQCRLISQNTDIFRNTTAYKCRHEPMPPNKWNILARNSTTRLSCPIGCKPDADLSVLVKSPRNNSHCQKYHTYGKYRDHNEGEWYLWMTEPCRTNITTWCRFNDIPTKKLRHQK